MNKITEISRNEINKVIEETKARDGFLVELDGKIISTEKDYVLAMREKMEIPVEFPNPVLGWLNDYLCDLSWMDNNCITIIIWNYNNFLNESLKKKNDVFLDFEEIILPWWEEDVKYHMVGGKTKDFNVYLVV